MPLEVPSGDAATAIDEWFKSRSDHSWEHQYGLICETTDNSGWMFTIQDLELNEDKLADVLEVNKGDRNLFRKY